MAVELVHGFKQSLQHQNLFKSLEFRLAAFLRLAIPLPFSQIVTKCDCGASIDEHGYHLLTCKFAEVPVWEHNTIVLTLAK